MKALVIGATGATGKNLVEVLLQNEQYSEVHIFVRKAFESSNPKLKVHIVDFNRPEDWKNLVQGDVAYSCMGTSLKAAGSKEAQRLVDFDYQYNFAKAASENGVGNYVLVSAYGANAQSSLFYSKLKGELEDSVKKLAFKRSVIFQPGILERENSNRLGETIFENTIKFANALGLFKKYKPMPTHILAKAMVHSLETQPQGVSVVKLDEIFTVAKSG